MACSPETLGPWMQHLLDCSEQALIDCERPAGDVFLAPGAKVTWDNCCENSGQLWVRVIQLTPNTQRSSNQPCGIDYMNAQLGVGVLRCAHTLDDEGNPPTAVELTGDALGVLADQNALLDAISCCFATETMRLVINQWLPAGPLGGCVGGEWTLTIGYDPCICKDPIPTP